MDSREDIHLKVAANRIRTDDDAADRIGASLADMLQCSRSKERPGWWDTNWGRKTNRGLARTVISMLENEGENYIRPKKKKRRRVHERLVE